MIMLLSDCFYVDSFTVRITVWHFPLARRNLPVRFWETSRYHQSQRPRNIFQPIHSSMFKVHFHLWASRHFLVEVRATKRVPAMRALESENTGHRRQHTTGITEGVFKRTDLCEYGGKRRITLYFGIIQVILSDDQLYWVMGQWFARCIIAWLAICVDWQSACPMITVERYINQWCIRSYCDCAVADNLPTPLCFYWLLLPNHKSQRFCVSDTTLAQWMPRRLFCDWSKTLLWAGHGGILWWDGKWRLFGDRINFLLH